MIMRIIAMKGEDREKTVCVHNSNVFDVLFVYTD
jgi:hypothetical protein